MTLRRTLGEDASRVHELVERLLDSEDAVILLFDGHRAVTPTSAASGCRRRSTN